MENVMTDRSQKEAQKELVQKLVLFCLEKKQVMLAEKKRLEDALRIVSMDLEDLKEGRLDRIVERQKRDIRSIQISEFSIEEKTEEAKLHPNKWYKPYRVIIHHPADGDISDFDINSSVTKDYATGTYLVGPEKEVVHFRS